MHQIIGYKLIFLLEFNCFIGYKLIFLLEFNCFVANWYDNWCYASETNWYMDRSIVSCDGPLHRIIRWTAPSYHTMDRFSLLNEAQSKHENSHVTLNRNWCSKLVCPYKHSPVIYAAFAHEQKTLAWMFSEVSIMNLWQGFKISRVSNCPQVLCSLYQWQKLSYVTASTQ